MKLKSVAWLAAAGMFLTSVSVYSLTPAGGPKWEASATQDRIGIGDEGDRRDDTSPEVGGATFTAGQNLMIEGRLGHPKLATSGAGQTFVMLEVRGTETAGRSSAPASLSLVIDRSGSMRGSRLHNAIAGAVGAVQRLHDGDVVDVVTFDTRTEVVVPPTVVDATSRGSIEARIRGITLGGDTCISCGIDQGLSLLGSGNDRVARMLLLSDGDANNGVRDVAGFRAIGQRAQARGIGITTIGVDVDYNERILSAISQESNGRHYFVENDAGLERVFETEAEQTTTSVATNVEADVDLGAGVELVRVFDRSFQRHGDRVSIPLGSFARGDVKTVLLEVRAPHAVPGTTPVVDVELRYRDLVEDRATSCGGRLAALVTDDPRDASSLDPVVAGRVQRSETAATLKDANALFAQGKVDEARKRIQSQRAALDGESDKAKKAAPAAKSADVDRDFSRQAAALDEATQGFAQAPAAAAEPASPFAAPAPRAAPPEQSREGKGAVKRNQANAVDLAF